MNYKIIIALSFLISIPVHSQENDFDKLCSYFGQLDKTIVTKDMTKEQKFNFINELVLKNLKIDSSARKTWEVITYAVPGERYEMVQSTAAELLKVNWQCLPMKKHISMTGQ